MKWLTMPRAEKRVCGLDRAHGGGCVQGEDLLGLYGGERHGLKDGGCRVWEKMDEIRENYKVRENYKNERFGCYR
jgi:hypothetical protein|eukprot:scaffold3364_cov186-Alexandrium_tamarense.AAC.27